MGLDTYMIAESRACSTSTPTPPPDHHQRDKPTLCRGPGVVGMRTQGSYVIFITLRAAGDMY
jgi:hypothetical protein